jgi:hypothetical protein
MQNATRVVHGGDLLTSNFSLLAGGERGDEGEGCVGRAPKGEA